MPGCRLRGAAAGLLLLLLLAACGMPGPPPGTQSPATHTLAEGGVPLTPEHTLTAGDDFEIRFAFAPEFNDRVSVGDDGTVAPKLLGPVIVGGLTVPEATARLRELYRRQLRDAQPSLTVRAYAPQTIYVDGDVGRPGLIRSDLPLTVARAVAQAGGAKTGAATGDILVIRRDAEGHVRAYTAGLGIPAGAAEPFLRSFDVVYVPRSAIGEINRFLAGYVKNLPFTATLEATPTPVPNLIAPVTRAPR